MGSGAGNCPPRQSLINQHKAILSGLGLPNAAQGPTNTPACPSSRESHLSFMEGHRLVAPEEGELTLQVQELAINFGLVAGTGVIMGIPPASTLSSEVSSIEKSFAQSVHTETLEELEAQLAKLTAPAFFVLGAWRADKCSPSLTLQRLIAIFKWKHGTSSVLMLPRANLFFGVESVECAGPGAKCDPLALEIQAVLCALAPSMNQGMWKGMLRVYPEISPPWKVKVPVPIPPANLWSNFSLENCPPGLPCEGPRVVIGHSYMQVS